MKRRYIVVFGSSRIWLGADVAPTKELSISAKMLSLIATSGLLASPRPIGGWKQAEVPAGRPSTANCTWRTFEQQIDHFGSTEGTFPQRYCLYSNWWRSAVQSGFRAPSTAPGPILFYTGNESPVEEYINNTGLMWELGEQLGALLVFAEHRYEPLSHPALCGKGSVQKCFAFCTTAQALADWASLIDELRAKHPLRAPTVAFGGSYGGMLAGWFRMKYPEVVDGAIAASAPIWQLATTVRRETLDMQAVAITRGVSSEGGATDRCRDNLRAAWPLLREAGRSPDGLLLLSESSKACSALLSEDDLPQWAQSPYFYLAEGNYPFPSTYITYSVGPGLNPLPAWPMQAACNHLDHDFGIEVRGSVRDVNYTISMGGLFASVDWANATGNGNNFTREALLQTGVLRLAAAVTEAAGVWYNVTKDKTCYEISSPYGATPARATRAREMQPIRPHGASGSTTTPTAPIAPTTPATGHTATGHTSGPSCPVCPPCDDCPPCPVSYCDWEDEAPCSYEPPLSKTFSWEGICCNDALSQVDIKGVGRDIFWPPSHSAARRDYSVESIVGSHHLSPGSYCAEEYSPLGLLGAPLVTDAWSGWMTAYYGGRNISHHRNIVWSNGALSRCPSSTAPHSLPLIRRPSFAAPHSPPLINCPASTAPHQPPRISCARPKAVFGRCSRPLVGAGGVPRRRRARWADGAEYQP